MSEHQKSNDPKGNGFITVLIGIAIELIGEVYSASRENPSDENTKKANDVVLVRASEKTATATKVIGWFAGLTFGAAIIQAIIFNRQLGVMENALIDVERPVIFATAKGMTIEYGKPVIPIQIDNVGRQPAIINISIGKFDVQYSTDPGPSHIVFKNDGAQCRTFTIGEWVLRQTDGIKTIICERQLPLTLPESDGLNKNNMFGFLHLEFFYDDPLGFNRWSSQTFMLIPNSGKFNEVGSDGSRSEKKLTNEQRAKNQRLLIDTLLQINRTQHIPTPSQ